MEEVLMQLPISDHPPSPSYSPESRLGAFFCDECGGDNWAVEIDRGDLVCMDCGACDVSRVLCSDGVSVATNGVAEAHRKGAELEMGMGIQNNASGKVAVRQAYFNERLSQWALSDPEIPDRHWECIFDAWEWFCETRNIDAILPRPDELRQCRGKQIAGTYLCTKDEIGIILDRCDTVMRETGEDFEDMDEDLHKMPRKRARSREPRFKKKYFEKWLKIRQRLTGKGSSFSKIPPWSFDVMTEGFEKVRMAHDALTRNSKRKALPGYNCIAARFLDMCGISHLRHDFPPPKTRKTRRNLFKQWKEICRYNQWPYINSDEVSLGEAKPFISRRKKRVRFDE